MGAGVQMPLRYRAAPTRSVTLGELTIRAHVMDIRDPCALRPGLEMVFLQPCTTAALPATTCHSQTTADWPRGGPWQSPANQPFPGSWLLRVGQRCESDAMGLDPCPGKEQGKSGWVWGGSRGEKSALFVVLAPLSSLAAFSPNKAPQYQGKFSP